jgi:hypothetical protein
MNNLITYNNKLIENDSKLQVVKKGHFLAKDYQDDVLAISNTKLGRFSYTQQFYQWLVENNLYDNLVLAVGSDYGNLINSVPPDNLVQTAYDLSKFGNNAGQVSAALQPRLTANGYNFQSDRLICANTDSLKITGAITLSVWVKVIAGSANQHIIGRGRQNTTGDSGYVMGIDAVNRIRWDMYSASGVRSSVISGVIDLGWLNIVVTWDGTQNGNSQRIYINGIIEAQGTSTIASIGLAPTYVFSIGSTSTGVFYLLNSDIRQCCVFNAGLSEVNIMELYNCEKSKYGY